MRRAGTVLLTLAALAGAGDLPSAREVVVRRAPSLAQALRVATGPAWRSGAGREVAVVVDVTPYTSKAERSLIEAFWKLPTDDTSQAVAWRIAPLGGRFSRAYASPRAMALELPRILSMPTPSKNTMRDLKQTLGSFGARGGVIVYLADWHFEDDHRLESLVAMLRGRAQVFSTIGSEAAFSRGWNDGFFPAVRKRSVRGGGGSYDQRIGRNPFGQNKRDAPWHGGDSAYPHRPAYIGGAPWNSEFPTGERDRGGFEDLRERLRDSSPRSAAMRGAHPLPSTFGPYGLMRLAAATGGRYVLWSFNPSGRSNVRYDYGRCDRFAPDLRPRDAILADVARRPLARALLGAWHIVAGSRVGLAQVTPPVDEDRRSPREMERVKGAPCACFALTDRARLRALLRSLPRGLEALDHSMRLLDNAIEKTASPDRVDARLLADARLFRHVLAVQRFCLGEVLMVAKNIPADAWDHPDQIPCIFPEQYLLRGADPEHVVPRTTQIFDHQRGADLAEQRRGMLRRYAGTPFGETVARNEVVAYRFGWGRKVPPGRGKSQRTPAQSAQPKAPTTTPGGGSSGAPGATSGG